MKKTRWFYIVGICIAIVAFVTVGWIIYTLSNGSKVTEDDKKEVEGLLETVLRTAYIDKDYEKADTYFYPELNEEDMLWEVEDIDNELFEDSADNEIVGIEVEVNEPKEFKYIKNHCYDHEKDAILEMQKVCDDGKFYVYSGYIYVQGTENDFTVEMSYDYPPFIIGKVEGKWECINYHKLVDMYYDDLKPGDMSDEQIEESIYEYMKECITLYEMEYGELIAPNESMVVKWDSEGLLATENSEFNDILISEGKAILTVSNENPDKYSKVDIYKDKNSMYNIEIGWE